VATIYRYLGYFGVDGVALPCEGEPGNPQDISTNMYSTF